MPVFPFVKCYCCSSAAKCRWSISIWWLCKRLVPLHYQTNKNSNNNKKKKIKVSSCNFCSIQNDLLLSVLLKQRKNSSSDKQYKHTRKILDYENSNDCKRSLYFGNDSMD